MEDRELEKQQYHLGEIVYVIYRNPHIQDVTQIQEAVVVAHPDLPEELCLFLHETYYPIDEQIAIYKTATEAETAYNYYFEMNDAGGLHA